MSTITVTRTERDAITQELWLWEDGDLVSFATREEAAESVARLAAALQLRDELGWNPPADTSSIVVTVTDRLVDLLNRALHGAQECVVGEREARAQVRAGNRDYWPVCSPTLTAEEVLSMYDRGIAALEAEGEAFAAVLARIDVQAVTA